MTAEEAQELLGRCLVYMKAEEVAEDEHECALVCDLIQAAAAYLQEIGIRRNEVPEKIYEMQLLFPAVLHDYDHRDDTQAQADYPMGLRRKMNLYKQRAILYND